MPSSPAIRPPVIASAANTAADWRWPVYAAALTGAGDARRQHRPLRRRLWRPLLSASYVEWRYFAVLSTSFHGIVGLALVNPEDHFGTIAESGLLLIVAGVLHGEDSRHLGTGSGPEVQDLCWMHLFPSAVCRFDTAGPTLPAAGSVTAEHAGSRLMLHQRGPADAELRFEADVGLCLHLTHTGVAGSAIDPILGDDFRGLPSGHWVVHCPAPVAGSSGRLEIAPGAAPGLASSSGVAGLSQGAPRAAAGWASPALLALIRAGGVHCRWADASGYYEHSFGIHPLPLHGWDFLFVPDLKRRQSLVLQTYRDSRQLRYVDVCWQDHGEFRHHRFGAPCLSLQWAERIFDPVLGVYRPLCRRIRAKGNGLRLEVDNRVLHRIPLLRRQRLAVRHFFISEEIGIASWRLSDEHGRTVAVATDQPCGGELAHFRWRTPSGAGQ